MIVMIDNKDSFTYNVVDLIYQATSCHVEVIDIHDVNIDTLQRIQPEAIVISLDLALRKIIQYCLMF